MSTVALANDTIPACAQFFVEGLFDVNGYLMQIGLILECVSRGFSGGILTVVMDIIL